MKKKIHIQWMHCASCEMLIKRSSEKINGVKVVNISSKQWTMDVDIPDEKLIPLINQCISDAGYKVINENQVKSAPKIDWKELLQSTIIVWVLAFVFYKLDIIQYVPSVGDKLSFGVALLMGLIASVSTCLAIVGSIVIWFSQYWDKQIWTKHHIRTQLAFHIWRIGWFFILWWLLWLIGQVVAISLTGTTILTIIVGIVVLWMWLHLLNILPNITSLWFHLPKSWSEKTLTTKNPIFAPLIGALTFFLPCGFTLSMQLIAVNTSNFRQWWLAMAIFALWTAPVLFAVWLWSSYIKDLGSAKGNKFKLLHTIIWTLIVFFGIFMITNGRRMFGWLSTFSNNVQSSNFTGQYERIEIWHDGLNLVPEIITLTAGKNYELIITPSNNGRWCMVNLTIPGLDRSINGIIKNQPIVYKFNNIKSWKYNVVCWTMWMYQWQIIVK